MPATPSESRQKLLGQLLRGRAAPKTAEQGIVARADRSEAPISYGQQQVWLHSQYSTQVQLYNEPITVYRYGRFDRQAMELAFTEIVRRHEVWRTTFAWKDSELIQRIQPPPERIPIPFLDVSALPVQEREPAALKVAKADVPLPFDLEVGPMYRPHLVRFSDDEHRLFLTLHHIIFDGFSLYRVFLPELQTLYDAFSDGRPSPLEPLPIQYGDYAAWHRKWVDEITPAQLPYWRKKLQGVERRNILRPGKALATPHTFRGAMETMALDAATTQALKDLSQRSGATLFMTLLATFHALIWAYSREDDLLSGGTSAGRHRSETHHLMGFFVNTIVLRTDLSGNPTFLDVIERGKEELISSLDHDGIPFENLVKEFAVQREGAMNPFFEVSFTFEPPLAPLPPNWKFSVMDIETGAAKFDLHLELDERKEGILGRFIYSADRFDRETIQGMSATWSAIVSKVVSDPSRRLAELVPSLDELCPPPVVPSVAEAEQAVVVPKPGGWLEGFRRNFRRK